MTESPGDVRDPEREVFEDFRRARPSVSGIVSIGVTDRHFICNYVERLERQLREYEALAPSAVVKALAALYEVDAPIVARVCDEEIDPSGALLGRVRIEAANRRKERERGGDLGGS